MDGGFPRLLIDFAVPLLLIAGCGPAARPVDEVSASPDQVSKARPISVANDDWPWWRGPDRNNVASCDIAPTDWSDSRNVVWKVPISGRGHGSPTVVGDRVFLCTADEDTQQQKLGCFDRVTGQQHWDTVVHTGGFPDRGGMHAKSSHANCTVACDGTSLFVGFLNSEHVTATSLTMDGEIRWQTDLGFFVPRFGYAPSPCLFESLAIFSGDNRGGAFLAAVDRESGSISWRRARNNVSTYSSAITVDVEGQSQLIISGDERVAAYDPLTGQTDLDVPGNGRSHMWHSRRHAEPGICKWRLSGAADHLH